jgi:hypothetical protein
MFSVLALSPVSAKMMACTQANIGTSAQGANTDVSTGKMRSACKHYMKAQKMSMAK